MTIPSRALVWHLEKQLLCFTLEKYSCNEMFMFKTRYGYFTYSFYVMKRVRYFKKSLSILMFSHIFILHNKTLRSWCHPDPSPPQPPEATVFSSTCEGNDGFSCAPKQPGRQAPRTPASNKQVLLTLGLWLQRSSNPKHSSQLLGLCTLETQGCVFVEFLKLKPHICNTNCREENPKQLLCSLLAFNLLKGDTQSSSWFYFIF